MSETIETWLATLGLERYVPVFADNDVDMRALPHLTDADLRELGVSLGHRRILLTAVAGVELETREEQITATAPAGDASPSTEAELRLLSILFCDLVDSTGLSQSLDPEAMHDLLRRYQDAVAGAITRYEGHVAKFLGDGVLAYFGWPVAYEDHAERAIRAGVEALEAVGDIESPQSNVLAARVGIATGQVVVGDLVGLRGREEGSVAGETPNLAARIQTAAAPNEILIGHQTARLAGGTFDLEDRGECALRGFEQPAHLYRVAGERPVESRFEAARGTALTDIVGRVHELGLLRDRWATARGGQGQLMLLSGEAGVGKSRLVEAFFERVSGEPHEHVRLQCSPYHKHSALHPIIERLGRLAGFAVDDGPADRLAKLERSLRETHDDISEVVPLFADLLSIDTLERYSGLDLSPEELNERTQTMLVERLVRLGRRAPVLMIVEDAHWIDPTTEAVLERVAARIANLPVLMVITLRPEGRVDWAADAGQCSTISLGRLDRTQVVEMIGNILGKAPQASLADHIVERTDGIPLFVEELTRAIVEGGGDVPDNSTIPATLRGSLMARLDRLPPTARTVAQVASVIGREFDERLLRAATKLDATVISNALEQLRHGQLVVTSGAARDSYLFRHALIQDTAYQALLTRTRREHHLRIAEILIADRTDLVDRQPEAVARHFTEAGHTDRALPYWFRATRRALARAANYEAVSHAEKALTIASELSDADARDRELLPAQLLLGSALAHTGRLQEAMPTLLSAIEAADRQGDDASFIEAVFEFDTACFLMGDGDRNAIDLLQRAAAKAGDEDHRTRCRILSRLARAMLMASDGERAAEYNRQAGILARRIDDRRSLFDILVNDFLLPASARPRQHMRHWRSTMDELLELAERIDDDSFGRALSLHVYVSAEMGDRERMDTALERLRSFSEERQRLHVQWIAAHGLAMQAIMGGDYPAAERHAEAAFDLGPRTHGGQFEGVYGIQMFTIRREQGRLAEVAPVIKRLVDDNPNQSAWKPGFALVACDLGFMEPAQRMLDEIAAGDFAFPLDAKHSTTLAYLAEVCVALDDDGRAESLYELLLPYRTMTITAGVTTVCYGAAGRFLGALAATFCDWTSAEEHFETALTMNERIAAPPWLAHTRCAYADMLYRRGGPGDKALAGSMIEKALDAASQFDMVALKKKLQRCLH